MSIDIFSELPALIDQRLNQLLSPGGDALIEAMRYSTLGEGKKIRPIITILSALSLGVEVEDSINAACAIELVHSYSLIHDDLPAMDNDELRRGKPSCHMRFDEATAILAGDALLTLAFELLSQPQTNKSHRIRCELISVLAKSIGVSGMAGGQMRDLYYESRDPSLEQVEQMLHMKTGCLFGAAAKFAAIIAKRDAKTISIFERFGYFIGKSFQIIDDLLDLQGNAGLVGKRTNKDVTLGKKNLSLMLGAKKSLQIAKESADSALKLISDVKCDTHYLRKVLNFIIDRKY